MYDYIGEVCDWYKVFVCNIEKKKKFVKFVNDNFDWFVCMFWFVYYKEIVGEVLDILDKKEIIEIFEWNVDIEFFFVVYILNGLFVGYENGLDFL